MKFAKTLTDTDILLAAKLNDFVPEEIFDIHAHPYQASHFPPEEWPFLSQENSLGCLEHRTALQRYMPAKKIHGLYFGMPRKSANRKVMNTWVAAEVSNSGTSISRALMVVAPEDDRKYVAEMLRSGMFCGIKVYHCYASRPDTMNASIIEYAPEWMWELLHEIRGVMMLHIVREGAIDDRQNQAEIYRLCRTYHNARLILAHVARSFNYRNARNGLQTLIDLDNVVVDTSAVCESDAFLAALKTMGPQRILWGSDFAVSEARGRCVTIGDQFFWLSPEIIQKDHQPPTGHNMTLVGIESLLSLRDACEDSGLTSADLDDIFLNNALRLLKAFMPKESQPKELAGPDLWKYARTVISGGTGLLSKRAEMYDATHWPAYFSRCSGCEVWDTSGRRYIDFAGGIGAVLLGYADTDVTLAVQRRLLSGSYCSLVDPQEIALADKLLRLHPWAGKVRYARGGGEAMAMAVRIGRAATGKSGVAFCGYHGWHDWYLAANLGDTSVLDGHLLPGLSPDGVPRELKGTSVAFVYNDMESFDKALKKLDGNLAVVVMEPMRSQFPKDDFVKQVAARCREAGAVFIVDEITSGLRYGFPGALCKIGVDPDIVVYAKAISNGFPFAAIIGRGKVMTNAEVSFISSSYWTDGVGPAAALAVLEKMERLNVQEVVWDKGIHFKKELEELAKRYPACQLTVGGMPASPAIGFQLGELSSVAKKVYIKKMLDRGFLVSSIFYLMYAHKEQHIERLLQALEAVFAAIEEMVIHKQLFNKNDEEDSQGFARLA